MNLFAVDLLAMLAGLGTITSSVLTLLVCQDVFSLSTFSFPFRFSSLALLPRKPVTRPRRSRSSLEPSTLCKTTITHQRARHGAVQIKILINPPSDLPRMDLPRMDGTHSQKWSLLSNSSTGCSSVKPCPRGIGHLDMEAWVAARQHGKWGSEAQVTSKPGTTTPTPTSRWTADRTWETIKSAALQ
jgi:hypothetical protein